MRHTASEASTVAQHAIDILRLSTTLTCRRGDTLTLYETLAVSNTIATNLLPAGEARLWGDLVRESEVRERDAPEASVAVVHQQNVFWLDIAMQDAWMAERKERKGANEMNISYH